jgi:flavodoxin
MSPRDLSLTLAPLNDAQKGATPKPEAKILVAYFSWSGFTAAMARAIAKMTGGALHEIEPDQPYHFEYEICLYRAKDELATLAFPDLKNPLFDHESFSSIFLGFPNWLGSLPRVVATFLKLYDFYDSAIIPFCANGGDGCGRTLIELKELAPMAELKRPLVLRTSSVSSLPGKIESWLTSMGFLT